MCLEQLARQPAVAAKALESLTGIPKLRSGLIDLMELSRNGTLYNRSYQICQNRIAELQALAKRGNRAICSRYSSNSVRVLEIYYSVAFSLPLLCLLGSVIINIIMTQTDCNLSYDWNCFQSAWVYIDSIRDLLLYLKNEEHYRLCNAGPTCITELTGLTWLITLFIITVTIPLALEGVHLFNRYRINRDFQKFFTKVIHEDQNISHLNLTRPLNQGSDIMPFQNQYLECMNKLDQQHPHYRHFSFFQRQFDLAPLVKIPAAEVSHAEENLLLEDNNESIPLL